MPAHLKILPVYSGCEFVVPSGVEAESEGDQAEEEELAGPGHPVLHLPRYGGPHCSRAAAARYL